MNPTSWLTPDEWQAIRISLIVATRSVAFGLPLAVLAAYAAGSFFLVQNQVHRAARD